MLSNKSSSIHSLLPKGIDTRFVNYTRALYRCSINILQIFSQHEPWEVICWDTGLGFERTDDMVSIHIFAQGRNRDQKMAMYAALGERLEKECGVKGNDLLISVTPNAKEDWSFGYGRAQFLTGEL